MDASERGAWWAQEAFCWVGVGEAFHCEAEPTAKNTRGAAATGTATELSWAVRDASTIVTTQTSCLSAEARSSLASRLHQSNLPDWLAYDPVSHHDDSIPQECYFVLDTGSTSGITSFLSTYLTQTAFDYAARNGATYLVGSDPERKLTGQAYPIVNFPTHILIDREGIVRSIILSELDAEQYVTNAEVILQENSSP